MLEKKNIKKIGLNSDELLERVKSKIKQARYELYLEIWCKGDDYINNYNSKLNENQAQLSTTSEAYDYYLNAWCRF